MLLTITTTHTPATDLGFLLHKHPDNVRTVSFPFGDAHVFFPEAGDDRCTAALLVEVDPVGLVRRRRGRQGRTGELLAGRLRQRPALRGVVASSAWSWARCSAPPWPAAATSGPSWPTTALPVRGRGARAAGPGRRAGAPVAVRAARLRRRVPNRWRLDDGSPTGATSRVPVGAAGRRRCASPTYWRTCTCCCRCSTTTSTTGSARTRPGSCWTRAARWLADHPARELISRRYLKHRRSLADDVLARLADDDPDEPGAADEEHDREEGQVEDAARPRTGSGSTPWSRCVGDAGAARVLDLGCGEGRLVQALLDEPRVEPGDRRGRVDPGAGAGRGPPAPGRPVGPPARPGRAAPRRPDLPRQPLRRVRRRDAGRGGRAPRRAAPGRARAGRVRPRRARRP